MSKRITIIIDDDILKKLREKQSKIIKNTAGSVSLSRVLNEVLRKNLKINYFFNSTTTKLVKVDFFIIVLFVFSFSSKSFH